MKFVISNIGSRGDIQPYIALAKQLKTSGHEVAIATHPYTKALIEAFGVRHVSIGKDISVENEVKKVLIKSNTPTKGLFHVVRFIIESLKHCHNDLMTAIKDADTVIVGHNLAGMIEAELLNKPYIRVAIDVSSVPTRKPSFLSKYYFQGLLTSFFASVFLKPFNKYRKSLKLPAAHKSTYIPKLTLLPISKEIQLPNELWLPNTEISGYWFLDTPIDFKSNPKLLKFIQNGSKPIFISLGSMYADLNQIKKTLDIFVSSTTQANERAVILMPIEIKEKLPDSIFLIKSIPYSWLLEKVSLVVHHCGFGTTAEVMKAGLPSIPIPHIFDQFKNANKLYKLGLAYKPLDINKLNATHLARAISAVKDDDQMRAKTEKIGQILQNEKGTEKAVELICKHLNY